jgi:hypothetical protein
MPRHDGKMMNLIMDTENGKFTVDDVNCCHLVFQQQYCRPWKLYTDTMPWGVLHAVISNKKSGKFLKYLNVGKITRLPKQTYVDLPYIHMEHLLWVIIT